MPVLQRSPQHYVTKDARSLASPADIPCMLSRSIFLIFVATGPCISQSTFAQTLATSDATPNSQPLKIAPAPQGERLLAAQTQTLLARSNFSPGLIDGKLGRKTKLALDHYQRAKGLDAANLLSTHTGNSWTRAVLITNSDLELITGPIPEDWNERALLSTSGYADLTELLCERGWCTPDLLQLLNPTIDINSLAAGDEIIIPDVPTRPLPQIARLEINLKEQIVLGFNSANEHIFLTHCSIARQPEKRPRGTFHIQTIVTDPDYTFDPKDWPEITNVMSRLRIAPGPRTPVGSAWLGLDLPSYGLHGTVRPQDIGKTGSHGCFRLYNWDATRLARAVKIGDVVEVYETTRLEAEPEINTAQRPSSPDSPR